MNIPKAIELLQQDLDNPGSVAIEDVNEAEQLGIKALELYKHCHEIGCDMAEDLLPGETKT